MKEYGDLSLTGTAENLQRFIEDMTGRLNGWVRNTTREQELARDGDLPLIAITTPGRSGLEAATLYLAPQSGTSDTLYVSNIVPLDKSELTEDEYNHILEAFYKENISGHTETFGLLVERNSGEFTAEELVRSERMSAENLARLRRFSSHANKSTGPGHPLDKARCRSLSAPAFWPVKHWIWIPLPSCSWKIRAGTRAERISSRTSTRPSPVFCVSFSTATPDKSVARGEVLSNVN